MTFAPIRLTVWTLFLLATTSWVSHFSVSQEARTETHTYAEVDGEALELDLRVPQVCTPDAPGVVFLHGGGFQSGRRDVEPVAHFLDALADAGIASASISYRLTMAGRGFGCDVPSREKQSAVEAAASDAARALTWLQARTDEAGLPTHWVIAGSSAGAEAALWSAYSSVPNRWAGAMSFSGALDAGVQPRAMAPPLLAVHGTCDPLVPVGRDLHHFCSEDDPGAWLLVGGPAWADSLRSVGVAAWTRRDCGAGHSVCNSALIHPEVKAMAVHWLRHGRDDNADVYVNAGGESLQGGESCPQPCN